MRLMVMRVCLVLLLYFTQCDGGKSTGLSRGLPLSQPDYIKSIKKLKIVNTILKDSSISAPCVSLSSFDTPASLNEEEAPPSFCVLPLSPPSSPIGTIPSPTYTFPSPAQNNPTPPTTFPTPTGYIPIPDFGPTPITPGPPRPILSPPALNPSPPVVEAPVVFPAPPTQPNRAPPGMGLWCVAKPSVPDPIIQEAMDYACGSGADCGSIQPSGSCFQPDTLYAHASYAFNSFWQTTKVAGGTCDFGGTAMLVALDPSYGGCSFLYY